MKRVSLITPALPTRTHLLAECLRSAAAQELRPCEHLVALDYAREGPASIRNRLAGAASGEWLAFLDDDDVLLPNHLRLLLDDPNLSADVIYSHCAVEGRVDRPDWTPNAMFDPVRLRAGNFIPVTCVVRRSAFTAVNGFRPGPGTEEDWDLWLRMLDAGARFLCVPTVTWIYRFHGGNRTYQEVTRFNPYAEFVDHTLEPGETIDALQERYPEHWICFVSNEDREMFQSRRQLPAGSRLRLVRRAGGVAY